MHTLAKVGTVDHVIESGAMAATQVSYDAGAAELQGSAYNW